MYLCYLDESGVPEIPGNSTHFVLAGIAIPIERWREADAAISVIMNRYGLGGEELHTAWLLRKYLEQSRIDKFEAMDWDQRKVQVARLRVSEIHRVRKLGIPKRNSQLKKVYQHTSAYIHLTFRERQQLALEIVEMVANWDWARLFASCIDKSYFLTLQTASKIYQVDTEAFSRILYVFAHFLREAEGLDTFKDSGNSAHSEFGLLIHDNNPTVAAKHTRVMQKLREPGTHLQEFLEQIIETPLFVDSASLGWYSWLIFGPM